MLPGKWGGGRGSPGRWERGLRLKAVEKELWGAGGGGGGRRVGGNLGKEVGTRRVRCFRHGSRDRETETWKDGEKCRDKEILQKRQGERDKERDPGRETVRHRETRRETEAERGDPRTHTCYPDTTCVSPGDGKRRQRATGEVGGEMPTQTP